MASTRPNILFLFSDQHRYDACSCNGAPVCRTPAIDSIRERGMRFTNAYTCIALCSPARASLMTGRYPHNHGLLANMGNFNSVFDEQVIGKPAFPPMLSSSGYRVGYAGKWHISREGDSAYWKFDRWHTGEGWQAALKAAGISFDYGRNEVQRLEWGEDAPFYGRSVLPSDKTQEAWVADRAVEMIGAYATSQDPFMVVAAFHGPHFPYAVPAPYDTMYDPAQVERWGNFDEQFVDKPLIQQKEMLRWNASQLTWPDWQRVIACYWGYCSYIDDQIRRILDALAKSGAAENTVVVYAADHGDMLGSHRLFNKGFNMYEEDNHIPLIVSWPRVTKPGSTCDSFVNLVDFMPSFLDIAGVERPEGVDGRSIVPLLRGSVPDDWPDDVYGEFHGYEATLASIRMVRTRRWKYVYNPTSIDELYDMESDPGELHNLAGMLGYGHVLRRMKARMVKWLRTTNDGIIAEGSWQSNSYDLYISGRER